MRDWPASDSVHGSKNKNGPNFPPIVGHCWAKPGSCRGVVSKPSRRWKSRVCESKSTQYSAVCALGALCAVPSSLTSSGMPSLGAGVGARPPGSAKWNSDMDRRGGGGLLRLQNDRHFEASTVSDFSQSLPVRGQYGVESEPGFTQPASWLSNAATPAGQIRGLTAGPV